MRPTNHTLSQAAPSMYELLLAMRYDHKFHNPRRWQIEYCLAIAEGREPEVPYVAPEVPTEATA